MLAERKRRERWSADPRNTRWSEDRSKFGYRMLERMGWREGQGLGRGLAGRREHVKVSRRSNTSGVGYVGGRDDGWVEHQQSFDQILASLNAKKEDGGGSEKQETSSLMTSAISSGRAVYRKVLRSKDLSSASREELDCVLGRRRRREREGRGGGEGEKEGEERGRAKRKKTENAAEYEQEEPGEEAPVISHGVATITQRTTVQEYFAAKLPKPGSGCGQGRKFGSGCGQGRKFGSGCGLIVKEGGVMDKKVRTEHFSQ